MAKAPMNQHKAMAMGDAPKTDTKALVKKKLGGRVGKMSVPKKSASKC